MSTDAAGRHPEAVAQALTAAFAARDAARVASLYGGDIKVWHNFDQVTQNKRENVQLLATVFAAASSLRYSAIRRSCTAMQFVQQHVIVGTWKNGQPILPTPVCLIAEVRQGQIVRIDEYLDPAGLIQGLALADEASA